MKVLENKNVETVLISGIAMLIGSIIIVSYFDSYVYTRKEGVALEKRVDTINNDNSKDKDDMNQKIDRISDKTDKIYLLLIEKKR